MGAKGQDTMTKQNEEKEQKKGLTVFQSVNDLKTVLAGNYQKQIENYFGNQKQALRFLSGVVADVQRTPKLLECTPTSVINSYMTMAQLGLMPSGVSGEAYVLPYANRKKVGNQWQSVMEAQFQLGYQGLVTLFYRAGARRIVAEIVYENDSFKYINGEVQHEPDVFAEDRGAVKGAYVIVELASGGTVSKVMKKSEILEIGERFSKSYKSDFTPWKEENDPQLWMYKKTVLKQCAKLVPKNDALFQAIAEDNKDSVLQDRLHKVEQEAQALKMGNLMLQDGNQNSQEEGSEDAPEDQTGADDAEGDTRNAAE